MKNKILGIVSIALSVLVAIYSTGLKPKMQLAAGDPGPSVYPIAAALLLAVCGIAVLFQKEDGDAKEFLSKPEWKRLAILFGLFAAYTACLIVFGFLLSSVVMLFVTCTLFMGKNKVPLWLRAVYSLVLGVGVWYLLKTVFTVSLPTGILFG